MPPDLPAGTAGRLGAAPTPRPAAAAVLGSTGFAALFCAAVLLGRLTVMDGTSLSLVWPAAGVAVVWFAVQRGAGTRRLDVGLLTAATFVLNAATGAPVVLAACFAAANVVQVLTFGALFARWCPRAWGAGGREPLTGADQLMRMLTAAVLATAAGALIGPTSVWAVTGHWSWLTASVWMTRNTVSILLIAGVAFRVGCLLAARDGVVADDAVTGDHPTPAPVRWPRGWGAVELAAVVVCSGVGYGLVFGTYDALPVAFPLIALTAWVALRFDTTIVLVHDLAMGTTAVLLTLAGHGPFAMIPAEATRAVVVQLYVGVTATLGLTLAMGRDERDVLFARMAASTGASERAAAEAAEQHALAEEQRDLAEQAMAESEARGELNEAILDTVDVGIAVATPDGHLAALNRTALQWHGLPATTALDSAEHAVVHSVYAVDGVTPLLTGDTPLARALRDGSVEDVEVVIAPAGEPPRTVVCSGRTLGSADGAPLGAVVVMTDVTASRAREAALSDAHAQLAERSTELERSNTELAQFAGVASHDLNSPLTVIAGYVEMLGEVYGEALGEQGREWVATALNGTTRMKELIEALLAYSHAGAARCQRERVDLRLVHDQAVLDLRAAVQAAGAKVSAASLPVLCGDPVLLRQLLQNLIGNAIKYRSPQRPCRIGVSAHLDGEEWTVVVADNGLGIPAEQREAVFAMFAQVDRAARTGHGIGLATCQRIVERHGGRIWVEETPGGGATVRFTMPQRTPTGPTGPTDPVGRVRHPALSTASLD